jgi:hypothetical protein
LRFIFVIAVTPETVENLVAEEKRLVLIDQKRNVLLEVLAIILLDELVQFILHDTSRPPLVFRIN